MILFLSIEITILTVPALIRVKKIPSSSQHLFVYVAYVSLKGMESNFKIAYFFQLFLVYAFR